MKRPHEYPEMCREAAIARVGADRMAAGLSCIPDPIRGDLDVVERLRARLHTIEAQAIASTEPDYVAVPAKLIHEQSVECVQCEEPVAFGSCCPKCGTPTDE